jgi:hypothetical protein
LIYESPALEGEKSEESLFLSFLGLQKEEGLWAKALSVELTPLYEAANIKYWSQGHTQHQS